MTDDPRELRRLAAEGKRAKAELPALRRELAMRRAGVPLGTPLGDLFCNAYSGDVDVETVKAEWAVIAPPPAPVPEPIAPEPQWGFDELRSTDMRSAMAYGSPADERPNPHPSTRAHDAAEAVIAQGGNRMDAAAATFEALTKAAAEGDARVVLPRQGPQA